MKITASAAVLLVLACVYNFPSKTNCQTHYEPNWDSLDKRPLPKWYDKGKLGIFIHWGVFSVPSFKNEWFWYRWKGSQSQEYIDFMKKNYPPGFTYQDFGAQFTAELYNPDHWADVFAASGAKYIVLTSKHHEGFTNWPSKYSWNWNAMDIGPKRDLVGDLANSIRNKTDLHFGLYHSMFEWFNPLYDSDRQSGFQTQEFVKKKTMPELYEIVNKYKPDVIWSDGDGQASWVYWNSTEFLAWLYNESPVKDTVVVNDRWGAGCSQRHGGFYSGGDRFNPGVLQKHKWENCMTIDSQSWGYRRDAVFKDYLTIEKLLQTFVETISCGGNMLMNVGPTKEGTLIPVFEERLRQVGEWLTITGEGVYESVPWTHQNDTVTKGVWYTTNNGFVYCFFFDWPSDGQLTLGAISPSFGAKVTLLGYDGPSLKWTPKNPGVTIDLTNIALWKLKLKWLWVLKFEDK